MDRAERAVIKKLIHPFFQPFFRPNYQYVFHR